MSLYNKLKYSATQLQKLAKERESVWPPPISFILMGNYTQQKGSSDKDDKKDVAQYVKFKIPLNIAEPNGDKYDRKVKILTTAKRLNGANFAKPQTSYSKHSVVKQRPRMIPTGVIISSVLSFLEEQRNLYSKL
jgi:hypothetical protein